MLQPNKNIKKAAGTGKKIVKASAISQILSNIPFADEVYDVANTLEGLKEGDFIKTGSNFIGALLPGVSGKAFEAIAEDWLPPTPEIEKRKMQFNLKSSPAERNKYLKKYGPGYLSNPQFIKDYKLAYGTGEDGIGDPTKPWLPPSSSIYQDPNFDFLNQTQESIDFSKPQLESQGFADIGVSKNTGKFNVGSGINFNPESLAARVGASFNDKGFNSALNYTQGERGFSEVNVNAGYGNDFIQGKVDYSKTNNGDSLLGNLNIGDDKLRLLLSYLKDSEGTNLKGGIQSTTALKQGLLNSALELDTNFEDPKISGRLNYTNPSGKLNVNAGASYSEGEKANFNAGLNYSFALGTDKNGIMKSKMNPRKKYAAGSDAKGMNVNNYVISPAEAMNDYNIMMAKVQQEAMSNPWLPIVAAVGGAAQSFVGNAGMYTKGAGGAGSLLDKAIPKGMDIIASTSTGSVEAAMGMNNVQADVEVEGGEMYETPQGQVGEFKGPSHEEEGIPLEMTQDPNANIAEGEVQEGTKVYSDRLKIQGKTLAERKEKRERLIANLEDTVSEPLVDQAIKNASKRKMMAIQKEEVADLDFQEKVNNIQQMADTMVAAFGTSMAGLQANPMEESMEYGYGSGMTGIMEYEDGTDIYGIQGDPPIKFKKGIVGSADYDMDIIKNLHDILGIKSTEKGYGTAWGKKSNKALFDYDVAKGDEAALASKAEGITTWGNSKKSILSGEYPEMMEAMGLTKEGYKFKGVQDPDLTGFPTETAEEKLAREAIINDQITEAAPQEKSNLNVQDALNGTGMFAQKTSSAEEEAEKPTAMGNLMRSLPGMGDMTKLFGNYLGMTSGIKTANEQRASDVTKTNVYKNAGEESQRLLDNAKKGIEISKAQAIVKANTNTRTGRKGARNSARGVNQMRAMDWLYDTALNQQIADISAGAAQQMSGIDIQKSGVAMNADQLKGAGEWQATMANDADKDAYYTALALGRKDFATGMQQSGKDLNSMKESKIIENLMKGYGKWVGADGAGNLANINKKTTKTSTKDNIEIPDGKGGTISMTKAEFQKLMDKVTNTK